MATLVLLRGIVAARMFPTRESLPLGQSLLTVADMPSGWRSGSRRIYRNGQRNRADGWAQRARKARLNAYAQGFFEGRGKLGGGSSNLTVYASADDAHEAFEALKGNYMANPRTALSAFETSRSALVIDPPIGDEYWAEVLDVGTVQGRAGQQFVVRWRQGRYICAVALAGEVGRFADADLRRLAQVQADRLGEFTAAKN